MKIKRPFLPVLILSIAFLYNSGCTSDGRHNIFKYYYPLDNLEHGLVYEYRPVDADSIPEEYWFFRTIYTDTAEYLTGTYYDHNFMVRQLTTEEIIENGALIKDYFLYSVDSLGIQTQIPAQVNSGTAFPFEVRDSGGIFLTNLKWTFSENPEVSTTMIKNRRYAGKTTYSFKGQSHDCVVFELKELVDDFNNGHWEKQYSGKEIYAKGLGLIYYEKEIDDNFILKYELADTFSMKQLEERFKATIGFVE